jgi:hypothetical protein
MICLWFTGCLIRDCRIVRLIMNQPHEFRVNNG